MAIVWRNVSNFSSDNFRIHFSFFNFKKVVVVLEDHIKKVTESIKLTTYTIF